MLIFLWPSNEWGLGDSDRMKQGPRELDHRGFQDEGVKVGVGG